MATCINLKTQFPKHRITYDPACEDKRDPWYFQIPCRMGTIYPYGHDILAVEVDHHPSAVRKLEAMRELIHHQYGEGEHTFFFHVREFNKVAKVVKPQRKRTVSPEYKKKLLERLRK
jgi:hypothetical protein